MLNAVVESMDEPDREQGIARYTSEDRLLMSFIVKGESQVTFPRRRAAWYLPVRIIRAIMGFGIAGNKELYLSVIVIW